MMIFDQDKFRGALLGLAAGDALGTTVEFSPRGTFTPLTDMVGGGPFNLKPGEWTDDTSMALCMGQSLIECDGMNLTDQLDRYSLLPMDAIRANHRMGSKDLVTWFKV